MTSTAQPATIPSTLTEALAAAAETRAAGRSAPLLGVPIGI
jgi:hypothetical protein